MEQLEAEFDEKLRLWQMSSYKKAFLHELLCQTSSSATSLLVDGV